MSEIETKTVWRCIDVKTNRNDVDGLDEISMTFQSEGHVYSVTVAGRAKSQASELVGALRAAAAMLLRAAGGNMSIIGAQTLDEAAMDTGDQRAN